MTVFAVAHRWRLPPGREEQFIEGWQRVSAAIHQRCGSHGSRLHQAGHGTRVAYALWPDARTRADCEHDDVDGERLMTRRSPSVSPG